MKIKKEYSMIKAMSLAVAALLVFSCAKMNGQTKPETDVLPPPEERLSLNEQNQKSLELFEEILEMTAEGDRTEALPRMEVAYQKIINEYPDAGLAQQSYWRLITIDLDDYTPPRIEEAKKLYQEFLKKYPNSDLRLAIDDTIARFFYRSYLWQELLEFCTPRVREYIKTGKLEGPFFLFLFTEASFNLGDLIEAEKGYKTVIEVFPSTTEAIISKDRLKEIKMKKR